jgi:transposase
MKGAGRMNNSITYVAMDTQKKEHKVAVSFPDEKLPLEFVIKNNVVDIRKLVNKVKKHAAADMKFCYEAGVCGFTLQRRIEALECKCAVIAPSLTPRKPGEKIKTDRGDAKKLLHLFKAGLLTEVYPPNPQQEAARELTRCRQTAQENLKRISHQLSKLLVRHGYVYTDGKHWTQKHFKWLRSLEFDLPLLRDTFDNYLTEMQHCMQRLETLDKEVERLAQSEPYKEIAGLLCCFHGIDTLTAITIITEIFEFGRFSSPNEFMSYLGLTPSEDSSGDAQHRGPITRTGNIRVRRLLVESGWHYRHPYNPTSKVLKQRRKGQPQWAINIAEKAGQRLRKRYWYLINHGKSPCKANVAIARELAGFIWAIFKEYNLRSDTKAA